MKKTLKSTKPVSACGIARLAGKGPDISRFFKGKGRMVLPIQRVIVDQHYLAQSARQAATAPGRR